MYQIEGGRIINVAKNHKIEINIIQRWQILMEMGFDLIVIELEDGTVINWLDEKNDLIALLHQEC